MDAVEVVCTAAENINLAFYQNAIPIIRDLSVRNTTGVDLRDVSVHLSSEPPFVTPGVWRIDRIADADIHHLTTVDLKLDQAFLSGLTASRRAELIVRVESSDKPLAERKIEVNLLPPGHWGGSGAAPELLAAFVRPTNSSIDVILREAADKLSKARRNPAIDGYAAAKKARAWELAEAIWAALVGHSIRLRPPPEKLRAPRPDGPRSGRHPLAPRRHRLDLALLYASCLEQAGLNPIVVLIEGHAFAGLWLVDEEYSIPVVDDAQTLRKRIQLQELLFVETTMVTGDHPAQSSRPPTPRRNTSPRTPPSPSNSQSMSAGPARRRSVPLISADLPQAGSNRTCKPRPRTNSMRRRYSKRNSRPSRRKKSEALRASRALRTASSTFPSETAS